jgi:multidrug efflux pump
MYGEVYGAVSQVPGLRVFPRLDPPLPTPGQYDVELVLQSDVPPDQLLETVGAVLAAGWRSGKFLYVDTDLKIDLPEARVILDRERLADLGLDLAGVGRELGTLLGGAYVNRFNYFDRSYKGLATKTVRRLIRSSISRFGQPADNWYQSQHLLTSKQAPPLAP